MRNAIRNACFLLSLALAMAADARAQSPDKFERVVPAKPQPAAPAPQPKTGPGRSDALVREVIREASAGEDSGGFCDRVEHWPKHLGYYYAAGAVGPSGGTVTFHARLYCAHLKVSPESAKAGARVRSVEVWACLADGKCQVDRETLCYDKAGNFWPKCP